MAFSDSAESPFNTVLRAGVAFFRNGFQAHHIIPTSVFDKLGQGALGTLLQEIGIDRDDTSANRLWLPEKADDALTLGSPVHNGSHPAYTRFVEAKLQDINDKYELDKVKFGPTAARASAQADVRRLQSIIPELLQTIDPVTGRPLGYGDSALNY